MRRRMLNAMLAEQEKRNRSLELAQRLGLQNTAASFEGAAAVSRPGEDASPPQAVPIKRKRKVK